MFAAKRTTSSLTQPANNNAKHNEQNMPRKHRRQFNYVGQLEENPVDHPIFDDGFESLTFGSILTGHKNYVGSKTEAFANITGKLPHFGNICTPTTLCAKFYMVAQGNILSIRVYKQMFPQNMDSEGHIKKNIVKQRPTALIAYGGTQIPH